MVKKLKILITTSCNDSYTAVCPELGWVLPYDLDLDFEPNFDNETYLYQDGVFNKNFLKEIEEGIYPVVKEIEISRVEARKIETRLKNLVKDFDETSELVRKIFKENSNSGD